MTILTNGQKNKEHRVCIFSIEKNKVLKGKGPIGKFFSEASLQELIKITKADIGDSIFFPAKEREIEKIYQQQGIK